MKTFRTEAVDKMQTHILYSVSFSYSCAIWEIMWKNVVEPDRLQTTIQYGTRELHVRLLRQEYNHILRIFYSYCFSTATILAQKRLSVVIHTLPALWFVTFVFSSR